MGNNQELYKVALFVIQRLFEDTSVSQEICLTNLCGLKDELDTMIERLDE